VRPSFSSRTEVFAAIALFIFSLTACCSLEVMPRHPLREKTVVSQPLAGQWAVFSDAAVETNSWIGRSIQTQSDFTADGLELLRLAVAHAFGLKNGDLSPAQMVMRGDGSAQVEFRQRFKGDDVLEAGIILDFDVRGRLTYFRESFLSASAELVKPALPSDLDTFIRNAIAAGKVRGTSGIVVIDEICGPILFASEGRLQWVVRATLTTAAPGEPSPGLLDVNIDILSGRVLAVFDHIHPQANPKVNVFRPTPLKQCTNAEYVTILPSQGFVKVDLERLNAGATSADGHYALFKDLDGYGNIFWTACTSPGVCEFRFDDWRRYQAFAELNAYYHIDAVQEHVQKLGFTLAKRPIEADAFANVGSSIAYYRNKPVGAGEIWFGKGVNTHSAALDGKVVVHEYGHALQAAEVGALLDKVGEPEAIAEGFADYLALSWFITDEEAPCRECLFAFMNRGNCYRHVGMAKTYNPALNPTDRYELGMIWMKALWLTVGDIETSGKTPIEARDIVDRGVLRGHERYGKYATSPPDMPTAALATLAAVRSDTGQTDAYFDHFCYGFTQQQILSVADCKKVKTLPLALPLRLFPD
jgi:hypothetical protein